MHYHLEIVMPPTEDVEQAVARILNPFDENPNDDEERTGRHGFWDYYVIGGRWSGDKTRQRLGAENLSAFYAWCETAGIMVKGVQFGKPTVATPEMREQVDAKWREMFPGTYNACPLFDHAGASLAGDVATLADTLPTLTAERVIVAAPRHGQGDVDDPATWTGPAEARFMISEDIWNGVTHVKTTWDGTLAGAITMHNEKMGGGYRESCRIASTPREDWLVVTVDYHS